MKRVFYTMIMLIVFLSLSNCSNDNEINTSESVINVDSGQQNDFDKYLNAKFTETYNIDFIYKYVDVESDMNYALVPASYKNSIKMANLVKYLCLDAYAAVAPSDFLKKYFPKMIYLVGSPAFRNNGTMVIGTAEGGKKITLYNINNLNPKNIEYLNRMYFRTIYHEFSHILHQTKDYSRDFQKISETDYVGDSWNEAWEGKSSLEKGFVSDYSSKEPNEDFVELIAHYITYTPDSWQKLLDSAGDGKALLEQKMEIVKPYMKDVWGIDLDALRKEINTRTDKLSEQDLDNITL